MRYRHLKFIFLCALMLGILITVLIPFGAGAEGEAPPAAVVETESKTVHRGQTFELTVKLKDNTGLISLLLQIEYDSDVFTLTNAVRGDALKTLAYSTTNTNTEQGFSVKPFRFLWDGREQDTTNGTLLTLTFESKIETDTGDYPITFTYDTENTKSLYGVPATVSFTTGTITLIKGEFNTVYRNYDGTVLYEKDYNENDVPSYAGTIPTRPEDEKYTYEFKKFAGVVSDNPKELAYVAEYTRTAKIYQVFLYADGEFFDAFECAYGAALNLYQPPKKQNYTFDGWYIDEGCTIRYSALFMQAADLRLYGQYVYNIRTEPIPQITLTTISVEGDTATVEAAITANPGFAGLVLTLDYDREALALTGFEKSGLFEDLQFDYTKELSAEPYKFYWESVVNNTTVGKLLTLKFKIKPGTEAAVYKVTFTYNEKSDATFLTESGEMWYTRVKIVDCGVPYGERFNWEEKLDEGKVDIKVDSEIGMPIDVVLEINHITADVGLTEEKIVEIIGEDLRLTAAYTISLKRNGVEVEPSGSLTVRIKLTQEQKNCKKLALYYRSDDGTMTLQESWVEDDELVFHTNHLSEWVILGDINNAVVGGAINAPFVIMLILLVITMSSYILILIAKSKRRGVFRDKIKQNEE